MGSDIAAQLSRIKRAENFETIWFDDNFQSGDYTQNGTTFSFSSGDLLLAGGTAVFTDYLEITNNGSFTDHCFERWIQTVELTTPSTLTASTFGFGPGVTSLNTVDNDFNATRFALDTSGSFGNRFISYDNSTFTRQQVPANTFAFQANTTYFFEVERDLDIIIGRLYSDAAKTNLLATWNQQPAGGYGNNDWLWHNTGRFAMYNFGGSMTVQSWRVEVLKKDGYASRRPSFCWIGDSNTVGFREGLATRFVNRVVAGAKLGTTATDHLVFGGIGDRTDEADLYTDLVSTANPRYILMILGLNDKRAGKSDAVTITDWRALADTLRVIPGAELIAISPPASNVQDMAFLNTDIQSYATTNSLTFLSLFDATKDTGNSNILPAFNNDGLHFNTAGHQAIANQLLTLNIF